MKEKLKFTTKSFTCGFLVASFFCSPVIYGGTLIDGIYQFASGDVLSSSEMNYNFQQLRGNVLLDATNTVAVSHQLGTATQECETSIQACASGYIEFGNESIGSIETRTDPSTTTLYSSTATGAMSFITIPNDGFYEITIIGSPDTVNISPPDEAYESTRFEVNFAVVKFDSTNPSAAQVTPNGSAMRTPQIDGVEIFSPVSTRSAFTKGDSTGDSSEDFFTQEIQGGVKKEIFLRANDGIAIFYWIFHENYNTPVGTDDIQYNVGSIRLKIKEVLD
jgi:hypothetical protein